MKFSNVLKEEKIILKETKISIILNRAKLDKNDPKRLVLDDSHNVGSIQDENGQLMSFAQVSAAFSKVGLKIENFKTVANIARQQDYYIERDTFNTKAAEEKRKAIEVAKLSGNIAKNPLRAGYQQSRS